MKSELTGYIIELIDKDSGYILGEDNIKYFFLYIDRLEEFNLKIYQKVIFKPIYIESIKQFRAILISPLK